MKIIIAGASGKIGTEVFNSLKGKHDIIRVGFRNGDITCDYTDPDSVNNMFQKVGQFDALISVIGNDTVFKPYESLNDEDYNYGFERKFLGQVRFIKLGEPFINDNGVFVLTRRLSENKCYNTTRTETPVILIAPNMSPGSASDICV